MKLQRELQDLQRKKKYRGWTIKQVEDEECRCGCLSLYKDKSFMFLGICVAAKDEDHKTFWVQYGMNDGKFNPFSGVSCRDGGGAPVYHYHRLSDVDWDWDIHDSQLRRWDLVIRGRKVLLHRKQFDLSWKMLLKKCERKGEELYNSIFNGI